MGVDILKKTFFILTIVVIVSTVLTLFILYFFYPSVLWSYSPHSLMGSSEYETQEDPEVFDDNDFLHYRDM